MKTIEFPFREGHRVTYRSCDWVVKLVAFNESRIVMEDKDSGDTERFPLVELYEAFYDKRAVVTSREGIHLEADSSFTAIAALTPAQFKHFSIRNRYASELLKLGAKNPADEQFVAEVERLNRETKNSFRPKSVYAWVRVLVNENGLLPVRWTPT